MSKWIYAQEKCYQVNLTVKPLRADLEKAEGEYEEVRKVLAVKEANLKQIEDKVAGLQRSLQNTQDEVQSLVDQAADCEARLIKAKSLIAGLGGEKTRWAAEAERLGGVFDNLTGDVLVSSGLIAYLGAFSAAFRSRLADSWVVECESEKIPNSGQFSLVRVLGDPVKMREWGLFGLPNDTFSVENAIINQYTFRWPLFIDPQGQANKWLKSMEKTKGLKVLKFTNPSYLKMLEGAIRMGNPVLIENIGEETDPAIEPLLQKQISKKGSNMTIKIGDQIIDYAPEFKFYLTTKLANPHYLPEVSTKVTLINFMITFEGLADQLLNIVVEKEDPESQAQKEQLTIEGVENKNKLAAIEDDILATLQGTSDILGDAKAIQVLENANVMQVEINKKQDAASKVEVELDLKREGYKPVSSRTSGLFFCITALADVVPTYQYSLEYFKGLFIAAIADSERSEELEERLKFINDTCLESLYRNICRSLFEKDKLLFSALLAVKLMDMNGEIDMELFKFFLTGGVDLGEEKPANPTDWMSAKAWGELFRLSKFKVFDGLIEDFMANHSTTYSEWYNSSQPSEYQLPDRWAHLDKFQFMCFQRCIRSDKLMPAIANFVNSRIGNYFVEPPKSDLPSVFRDSSAPVPLIFVLSPGADPLNALEKFADAKKKHVNKVSLGQGQGPRAENFIEEGIKVGNWVVLQNCHLAVSWMGQLEKICEDLPNRKPHRDFRLWLTSYPSKDFPVTVLQNGVKMTNEPPMGLKQNLFSAYATDPISNPKWFEASTSPKIFRKLLFGLCFYHSFITERKLYGPLGWNKQYQFNESDLRISAQQLQIFIDEYPNEVPLDALNYLAGSCNYGGRVTEKLDFRLNITILKKFYCKEIFEDDDYKFSPSGRYYAPKHTDYDGYLAYIQDLPVFPEPEVYGFHENAAISKNQNEVNNALETMLITQQSAGGGAAEGEDDLINNLADSILSKLPAPFDVAEATKKYPVEYSQSMNTVLTQELDRFNGLSKKIRSSLKELKLAIKGEVLLSAELETALNSLKIGKVPAAWLAVSYPSLKSLGGYMKDLYERLAWFDEWSRTRIPDVMWISRFFFTPGFLTGAKQNFARKYGIAIDLLDYDFVVVPDEENAAPPDDGVHVVGMFLEGAKWNSALFSLDESDPKVLYTRVPMFWFKPAKPADFIKIPQYECPVYKTSLRWGTLATTGHSTNHVLNLRVPSNQPEDHWILRGVAILLYLDD